MKSYDLSHVLAVANMKSWHLPHTRGSFPKVAPSHRTPTPHRHRPGAVTCAWCSEGTESPISSTWDQSVPLWPRLYTASRPT